MAESDEPVGCINRCLSWMRRDFQADLPHAAKDTYSKPIISSSLGIGMDQIADHKRQFPDIDVTPDGELVFDNYNKHQAYLKKTGHIKHPGKQRRKERKVKQVATATSTE
jgi:hypothetical protein